MEVKRLGLTNGCAKRSEEAGAKPGAIAAELGNGDPNGQNEVGKREGIGRGEPRKLQLQQGQQERSGSQNRAAGQDGAVHVRTAPPYSSADTGANFLSRLS